MLKAILQKATASEPGFGRKKVKWVISCASDGRFTGVIPLEGSGQWFDRSPALAQPALIGGGQAEPRANFLIESLQTVALFWKDDEETQAQRKFRAKHEYFCKLLGKAAEHAPYFRAAITMLQDDSAMQEIHQALKTHKARPTEMATIRIGNVNPLERDDWHSWWRKFRLTLNPPAKVTGKQTITRMCDFGTGELVEPAATHPKIGGLAGVGGLGTGDVLIGFDKPSFQSYGLEQSCNAAMAEETATAYTETLTRLIKDKGMKLGNILVTHWFTESESVAEGDDPFSELEEPHEQEEAVAERESQRLLQAIRTGERPDLARNRYVALSLSGQSGRVMVREVMEGSFETLLTNVNNWFDHLKIVSRDGKQHCRLQKFYAVAGSLGKPNPEFDRLYNSKTKKMPKKMPPYPRDLDAQASHWTQSLWRAAITGGDIPRSVAARAVQCFREDIIENRLDSPAHMGCIHARMGLMKTFHIRKGDRNMQPDLNLDHPDPAYHCGRALAVFARLQNAALGDVDSGVVQRYYTAMSQAPALFLGRLTANAQNHLNKLKPEKKRLAHWYDDQIACVQSRIGDKVPRTLTLEEQSLFALGYYQQLAKLFAGKRSDAPTTSATQDANSDDTPPSATQDTN